MPELSHQLRGFALNGPACVTYLNIAKWESWEAFAEQLASAGFKDRARGALGAVVRDDHPRLATPTDERHELTCNPFTRNRGVRDRRQTFACHVIHDVEDKEAPAEGELIVDEVERPARVDPYLPRQDVLAWRSRTASAAGQTIYLQRSIGECIHARWCDCKLFRLNVRGETPNQSRDARSLTTYCKATA